VDPGKQEVLVLQCMGIFSSWPSVVQRESPHFSPLTISGV